MKINRFSEYQFKNGLVPKNRVVVPPMASQTADEHGFVTARTTEHYARLARSRAGLVIAEYTFVHRSGKGEEKQLGADTDAHVSGLTEISSVIHSHSAIAGIQLVHAGGKTDKTITGAPLMGPSAVPVPVKGWEPETPEAMTRVQIQQWIEWFAKATERAVRSGFDLVELHAAHGYGLNQWLSSLTNKRSDSFGGSIQGRSRLLLKIASEIKSAFPGTLLSVRLPAQDHIPGGLTVEEMRWVASQLESLGADLINVSSGIGGWRRPEGRSGQGYLVADAAQIKSSLSLPVIGVGGIESGLFIDEIIRGSKVDFAAVGRAILNNPEGWGQQHLSLHDSRAEAV